MFEGLIDGSIDLACVSHHDDRDRDPSRWTTDLGLCDSLEQRSSGGSRQEGIDGSRERRGIDGLTYDTDLAKHSSEISRLLALGSTLAQIHVRTQIYSQRTRGK